MGPKICFILKIIVQRGDHPGGDQQNPANWSEPADPPDIHLTSLAKERLRKKKKYVFKIKR